MRDVHISIESDDFDCTGVEVHRLDGRETISQLFEFSLVLVVAGREALTLDELAGARVSVVFSQQGHELRRLDGMITQVADVTQTREAENTYRVEVRPHTWVTTMIETLDIQLGPQVDDEGGLTVPDIIRNKLSLLDFVEGRDFVFNLHHQYPKRNFVVQYQETDLQFISRLAEHVGICFFFEQHEGEQRMAFADHPGAHQLIVPLSDVAFAGAGDHVGVFELELERKLVPRIYVCRDYNYRTPILDIQGEHELATGSGGGIIDFGSHCKSPEEAQWFAQLRAEERGATREIFRGKSDVPGLSAGFKFHLVEHPRYGGDLLLVEVHHHAEQTAHGHGGGSERNYYNEFRAIDAMLPYRPPRITPVPRIHGLVTGVVETVPGETERYAKLDDQGRYRIKFLFDTAARDERRASKDLRMLQPSAGENYGVHFPLKPGTEVLMGFVNGDPDRPIVVGAVPNPTTPTPVTNSIHRKSRIRSESGVVIEIEDGTRPR